MCFLQCSEWLSLTGRVRAGHWGVQVKSTCFCEDHAKSEPLSGSTGFLFKLLYQFQSFGGPYIRGVLVKRSPIPPSFVLPGECRLYYLLPIRYCEELPSLNANLTTHFLTSNSILFCPADPAHAMYFLVESLYIYSVLNLSSFKWRCMFSPKFASCTSHLEVKYCPIDFLLHI